MRTGSSCPAHVGGSSTEIRRRRMTEVFRAQMTENRGQRGEDRRQRPDFFCEKGLPIKDCLFSAPFQSDFFSGVGGGEWGERGEHRRQKTEARLFLRKAGAPNRRLSVFCPLSVCLLIAAWRLCESQDRKLKTEARFFFEKGLPIGDYLFSVLFQSVF